MKLDGKEWEIKFQTDSYKFEAEINALTGKVKDFEKKKISVSTSQNVALESAKTTALNHAKEHADIDGDVRFTKAKLDRDDGMELYEIEFRSGWMEFEYEIDANSGEIVKWDMEYDD